MSEIPAVTEGVQVLRKLATGFGVALALFSGMAFTSGTASADTDPHEGGVPKIWVYVRWYPGTSLQSWVECRRDALQGYPGQAYDCRITDGNTLLWVLY
jgi:hypothetical protein